jgi:hypothetical protein
MERANLGILPAEARLYVNLQYVGDGDFRLRRSSILSAPVPPERWQQGGVVPVVGQDLDAPAANPVGREHVESPPYAVASCDTASRAYTSPAGRRRARASPP